MSEKCEVCEGYGFLHAYNEDRGVHIERCDACELLHDDDEAVDYVYSLAKTVVDKVREMERA